MKLIESKTLATAAASIEFTSIPQDGTDLVVLFTGRNSRTDFPLSEVQLRFNGLSTNQSSRQLRGLAGVAVESNTMTYAVVGNIPSSSNTSDTFGSSLIYIPNYAGSSNKSVSVDNVSESNNTSLYAWDLNIAAGLWASTSAITSLSLTCATGNIVAGSIASLYKITKGSDGIVTTS
jgi:hypothetical protein